MSSSSDISEWVTAHSDYLYRYAMKHFSQETVAEDLVQDTLLAAVSAQRSQEGTSGGKTSYRGESSVRTWLTGILRHKIVDRIRQQSRQKTTSLDDIGADSVGQYFDEHEEWAVSGAPVPWASDPDSLLEQKEFLAILKECLDSLPPRLREVFLLREWDERSRDEISDALSLTSTHVGVLLHRGRLGLRDCIQHHWLSGDSTWVCR